MAPREYSENEPGGIPASIPSRPPVRFYQACATAMAMTATVLE